MLKQNSRRKRRHNPVACEVLEQRALLTGLDLTFGLEGFLDVGDGSDEEFELTWDVEATPDGGGIALTANNGLFASGWGLTKFDINGAIDTSFGVDGRVDAPFDIDGNLPAAEVLPDGTIAFMVSTNDGLSVGKLLPNGAIDTSFATDGVAAFEQFDFSGAFGNSVSGHVDPFGNLIISGVQDGDGIVTRITSSGELDTTFGTDGVTILPDFFVAGLEVTDDGSIYMNGLTEDSDVSVVVTRLNSDGSLDTSFGTDGFTTFEGSNTLSQLLIFFGDGVDVADDGSVAVSLGEGAALLNPDGSPNDSFGTNGVVEFDLIPANDAATIVFDVVFDDANRLYLAEYEDADTLQAQIRRLNSDGTTDESFPDEGGINSFTDTAFVDLDLAADGGIFAAGTNLNENGTAQTAVVAKFLIEQSVDISDIIEKVESLELRRDRHLLSHLRAAEWLLERGRPRLAVLHLRVFQYHIRRAYYRGRISYEDGRCLFDLTNQVIADIREDNGGGC